MNTEKSLLKFLGYHVDAMHFELKPGASFSNQEIELEPLFDRHITSIGDGKYTVEIGVKLQQSNLPFTVELRLTGLFECEGVQDEQRALKINGVAILYPYVRSTLSLATSLASIPPIVLPTINLARMFEEEEQGASSENK